MTSATKHLFDIPIWYLWNFFDDIPYRDFAHFMLSLLCSHFGFVIIFVHTQSFIKCVFHQYFLLLCGLLFSSSSGVFEKEKGFSLKLRPVQLLLWSMLLILYLVCKNLLLSGSFMVLAFTFTPVFTLSSFLYAIWGEWDSIFSGWTSNILSPFSLETKNVISSIT